MSYFGASAPQRECSASKRLKSNPCLAFEPLPKAPLRSLTGDPRFADLERDGFQVIPGVLDAKECADVKRDMWNYLESLGTDIDRDDVSTWTNNYADRFEEKKPDAKLLKWPPRMHGGLMQKLRIGHSRACWKVRLNPKVQQPFVQLWDVRSADQLLCSFDGAYVGRPWQLMGRLKQPRKHHDWLHADQSFLKQDLGGRSWCVQGLVTLNDMPHTSSTLYVLKGSHKLWRDFSLKFAPTTRAKLRADWVKLTPEQIRWYEDRGCVRTRVSAPAGSLVLWKSNTIHQGSGPTHADEQRMVVYVCMAPRSLATPAMLAKKQQHFHHMRTCSHWPWSSKAFGLGVRFANIDHFDCTFVDNRWVLADPVGKRLAGF